jgi:hypothetical protein
MLGCHLNQGKRRLGTGRKEVIIRYPCPESWRNLQEFLGTTGFCHLWIPGFLVTAGPLYVALKWNPIGPLHWGPDQEDAFPKLKQHLGKALALALPEVTRPVHLYVHEKGGVGLGHPDPATGAMEPASSLPVQEIRPCGLRLAPMPPGIGSGSPLNTSSR